MTAAASATTGLASFLSNLNSNQLLSLGHHLTQSNEARALGIVAGMTTPTMASVLFGSLAGIPDIPPVVMTWITQAIANPANFGTDIANATAELQKAVIAPGLLGSLGL